MGNMVINTAAFEPLFAPHEEPNFHRVRAEKAGEPAGDMGMRTEGVCIIY